MLLSGENGPRHYETAVGMNDIFRLLQRHVSAQFSVFEMYLAAQGPAFLYLGIIIQLAHSSPVQSSSNQPLPLAQPSNLTAALSRTLGWGPVPDGFEFRPDIALPRRIPQDAAVINAVHGLEKLGQADYHGSIAPQSFNTARYPYPVINLQVPSPSKTTIERQYVIWALVLAIGYMDHHFHAFVEAHFTLLLHNEEIGGISFGERLLSGTGTQLEEGLANNNNTTTTQENMLDHRSHEIMARAAASAAPVDEDSQAFANNSITATPTTNTVVNVLCIYDGNNPLAQNDIFSSLLIVMAQAAVPTSETKLPEYWSPPYQGNHIRIFARATKRDTGPYLTYGLLIQTLARAADFLVAQQRYGRLLVRMDVGGVVIGQVLIRHM
ncbi:MAG: hypothetical protein Q9220_006213 [cf. Caloplaca sp. 1 TL-2023]